MQVNKTSYPVMNSTPNFTALKSTKYRGLYNKYPKLANILVDAFNKNPEAIKFCKKYDVDLVFYSHEYMNGGAESYIYMFFDDISRGKFKKFIDAINGKKKDVSLFSTSNRYNLEESLTESTSELREQILPEGSGSNINGLLSSHLKSVDEEIEEKLAKKAQKITDKQAKAQAKKLEQNTHAQDKAELDDAIKNLINRVND